MKKGKENPPDLAIRFLRWFCPPFLYESILGDLTEQFYKDQEKVNPGTARRRFAFQVLLFFRPAIILRNKFSLNFMNTQLFRSHIKISYRNILRNRGYSAINIFGLAIGIATCMITYSFIRFEMSFDDFHRDIDRLYRVNETLIWNPEGGVFDSTGPALAVALTEDYPEIQEVLRVNTAGSYVIRYPDEEGHIASINEDNVLAADSNFFDFFNFPLKEGNPVTALKGINQAVISEKVAYKFFGDKPALGKILLLGKDRIPVEITGVTGPQPENAHFHFDYLLSIYTNPNIKKFEWSWIWTQVVTYVKLRPGADVSSLEKKLARLGETRVKPSCEQYGIDYDQIIKGKGGWNFYLQPVRDIYLHSADIGNRLGPTGNITYSIVFGIIGLFVLLIASINYVNLATARGSQRAREIGVKKTMGAFRGALVWQFQVESILVSSLATLIAIGLAKVLKSFLLESAGINIPLDILIKTPSILYIPLVPLVIGFLAGIYPSIYLTAFKPVHVLKGKLSTGLGNGSLRNVLVTIQFIISIALITGTLIVYQQMHFLNTRDLGFNKENVLVINHAEKLGNHIEAFRDEIRKMPGVTDAAIGMDVPGGGYYEDIWMMEGNETKLPVTELKIDDYYFDFMGFHLVSGRKFQPDNPADQMAAIPNETAVRLFGYSPEEALGKHIIYPGDNHASLEIIGVVKDFNYHSLYDPVTPMVMIHTHAKIWGDMRVLVVRFKVSKLDGLQHRIESKWNELLDATPFSSTFLDQQLAQQYEEDQQKASLLTLLSGLSIIVAVIGLIGLISYSVEIRKKEIGIRKVFGASFHHIIFMLNFQYMKLMAFALLIASPITWWLIRRWLDSFAYKIPIHWLIFLLSGLVLLVVAFLCVGFLSFRAAGLNPSVVLNEE